MNNSFPLGLCFLSLTLGVLSAQEKTSPLPLKIDGIENVYQVTEGLLSGGTPENAAAFEKLKELGVTTIVSVDGAPPDLALAKKYGLRYVHLPVGYDGISEARKLELLKAWVSREEGALFVHCHHGKHRGPAAAAVIARQAHRWSADQSQAYMEQAGTAAKYRGLWRDVATCESATAKTLTQLPEIKLPESVSPPALVETMLRIDHRWEKLAFLLKNTAELSAEQRMQAREDSTQLTEHLAEWMRQDDYRERSAAFQKSAREMLHFTVTLEKELALSAKPVALQTAATGIAQQCNACHAQFRDGK
jgi:protein tyrosine phosphatase (PTP) superfamily phosphohydrolase (DUF442 family)